MESVEPYPHLQSGMRKHMSDDSTTRKTAFLFLCSSVFCNKPAASDRLQQQSVTQCETNNTGFSTYNAGRCESSYRLGYEVLTALMSKIQVVYADA